MTRRFSLAALFSCVLGLFVAGNNANAADNGFWWHNLLTQSGRNDAIVRKALSYSPGTLYGDQACKDWVRKIVFEASKGIVNLPSNANDWSWDPSPNVGKYSPQYPARGDIIQMRWLGVNNKITLHTMIVVSSDRSGLNVVDCNWYSTDSKKKNRVYRHTITWTEFRTKAIAYSIYYVR